MKTESLVYTAGLIVAVALFTIVPVRDVESTQSGPRHEAPVRYAFLADSREGWTYYTPYSAHWTQVETKQCRWQRIAAAAILVGISLQRWRRQP